MVALQAMTKPWEAVICATSSRLNVDEGGAPEKMGRLKLWMIPAADGKLTPELIDQQAWDLLTFIARSPLWSQLLKAPNWARSTLLMK